MEVQLSQAKPASPQETRGCSDDAVEDSFGEGEDLGKIPKFGEGIGVKNLATLGEVGKGSGGPHPESGLEALHSVVLRELKGGGKVRGEVNTIQLN